MTHFEFVSVAASLVYALVLARLLHGIRHALRPERRYWVHTGWVIQVLLMTMLSWWGLWAARDLRVTPVGFLSLMSLPAFLYMRAILIVPDTPREIRSWREYFFEHRLPFFGVTCLAPINIIFNGWLLFDTAGFIAGYYGGLIAGSATGLIGCLTANPRVHQVLVILSLAGGLAWFVLGNSIAAP